MTAIFEFLQAEIDQAKQELGECIERLAGLNALDTAFRELTQSGEGVEFHDTPAETPSETAALDLLATPATAVSIDEFKENHPTLVDSFASEERLKARIDAMAAGGYGFAMAD